MYSSLTARAWISLRIRVIFAPPLFPEASLTTLSKICLILTRCAVNCTDQTISKPIIHSGTAQVFHTIFHTPQPEERPKRIDVLGYMLILPLVRLTEKLITSSRFCLMLP